MFFPAHIRNDDNGSQVYQTSREHCRSTARYAHRCLSNLGMSNAGYLAGLVHDCGKFKEEFAQYLKDSKKVRGSVNHTFAGCRLLLERYHAQSADPMEKLSAELLALAVGCHHGLFDCVGEDKKSGFLHRMTKADIGYEESMEQFIAECASAQELDDLFKKAHAELLTIYQKLMSSEDQSPEEVAFQLGLLSRLLLSAVIEGDRRDTAEFMLNASFPPDIEDLSSFWNTYLQQMEKKLEGFTRNTPINRARGEISDQCRRFAEKPGGVYRLNVPTGAGKTLSSLRYALAHAQKWEKRRLIFTSPLLSILEQNVSVLRQYLADDSIILEHHSNALLPKEGDTLDLRELAVDSWNAPVIITTLVQLLNTLFDGRTTSIRRFQSLCNSIIVIDEVQTVPAKLLSLFNQAVDFLAAVCNATVILCSATQPCLEKTDHPLLSCRGDIIPYDEALWQPFRRTVITDAGKRTLEEIREFAATSLAEVQSLLVVCNRKDEAEELFHSLKRNADVYCHLSASMCMAHRRNALEQLEQALKKRQKCLCVATQVIEAGVDISFDRVIRLSAGMDNVIQAAGRCNRHGEFSQPVPVYVVSCLGEKLGRLREINDAKKATDSLLYAFRQNPKHFDNDLSSDQSIRHYYRKLYQDMPQGYQDTYIEHKRVTLFNLLSCNWDYFDSDADYATDFIMNQAFRTAGDLFQVFDNRTRDLIVPYGEGAELICQLTATPSPSPGFLAHWLKKARAYTVSVYDYQLQILGNGVTEYEGIALLHPEFYDEHTGLSLRPKVNDFLEV